MTVNLSIAICQAKYGLGILHITFKPESFLLLSILIKLIIAGQVQMRERDLVTLAIMGLQRRWGKDNSRTMKIRMTENFDEEYFIRVFGKAFEVIEPVTQNMLDRDPIKVTVYSGF